MGVYTIATDIWFDTFGYYNLESLEFTPYVITFIGFFFFFYPLKDIHRFKFNDNVFTSPLFKYIVFSWIVLILAFTIVKITEMYAAISIGLGEVYQDRHVEGNELVFMQHVDPVIAKIVWIGGIVSNTTAPVMMFYSLYLIVKQKKMFLPILILTLSILPSIIHSVAIGSRGAMVWSFFKITFFYIISKDMISKKMKRQIIKIMLSFLLLVLVNSIITTIERTDNSRSKETATSSVLRYFGEPFPNAGFIYWGNVTKHPMGKRFFPDYVGFNKDVGETSDEIFKYWENYTGVPILNWKILYIDCYIEFGVLGGLLFLVLVGVFFRYVFAHRTISVYTIGILYAYFEMCDSTFTGYNMFSKQINATITSILILNFLLYFVAKFGKRQKIIIN